MNLAGLRRVLRPLLVAAVLGCASNGPPPLPRPQDADYPGALRSPDVLAGDALWRQHVAVKWGEQPVRGFDAALQKRGATLTLLGLSPVGPAGFEITMDGEQIGFSDRTGEGLPIPPRFVLLDVQRVLFPWIVASHPAPRDGEYRDVVEGERVVEVWRDGRLRERRFTRLDGRPAGTITVRCTWGPENWLVPSLSELENGWFGYSVTVETLAETRLSPDDSARNP